jgi:ubiquinone biosynthesis protein UbiJ
MATSSDGGFSTLEALFTGFLTSVGHATLKLDPTSDIRLAALEGKSLRLNVVGPGGSGPGTLTLRVSDGELEWLTGETVRPNAILTGTLPDIVALLLGPDSGPGVTIEGDEAVLSEFGKLLTAFEPDLAGPIGNVLGQRAADDLIGLAEAGIALLKSAAETIGGSARESARAGWVADEDFDRALDRIQGLQLRVDRLAARVGLAERDRSA